MPNDETRHTARNQLIYQAQQFADVGQTDRAIQLMGQVLVESPDDVFVLGELARISNNGDQNVAGEKYARQALALNDSATAPLAELTRALLQQERYVEALEPALRFRERSPRNSESHALLAQTYAWQRSFTKEERRLADESAQAALALDQNPRTFLMIAGVYDRILKAGRARELIEAGLAIDPNYEPLLEMRARLSPAVERVSILRSLLAANPLNRTAATELDTQFRRHRARAASLTWRLFAALLLASVLLDGFFFLAAVILSCVVAMVGASVRHAAVIAMPSALVKAMNKDYGARGLQKSLWAWFYPFIVVAGILIEQNVSAPLFALIATLVVLVTWTILNESLVGADLAASFSRKDVGWVADSIAKGLLVALAFALCVAVPVALFAFFTVLVSDDPSQTPAVALALTMAGVVAVRAVDFGRYQKVYGRVSGELATDQTPDDSRTLRVRLTFVIPLIVAAVLVAVLLALFALITPAI